MKGQIPGLLWVSFNQDASYFSLGTEKGFKIYRLDPLKKPICCLRRELVSDTHQLTNDKTATLNKFMKGIYIVQMINQSNLLALVGGGVYLSGQSMKVWDDDSSTFLLELEFHSHILNVLTSKNRYVILYEFQKKKFLFSFIK